MRATNIIGKRKILTLFISLFLPSSLPPSLYLKGHLDLCKQSKRRSKHQIFKSFSILLIVFMASKKLQKIFFLIVVIETKILFENFDFISQILLGADATTNCGFLMSAGFGSNPAAYW